MTPDMVFTEEEIAAYNMQQDQLPPADMTITEAEAAAFNQSKMYSSPGYGAWPLTFGVLATASAVASTYHGYRRNNSLPLGLWWGLMGFLFPVVTPAIALAQGFGKRRGR